MQRHFSDTHILFPTLSVAQQQQLQHDHAPLHPSRLNPALAGRRAGVPAALLGRGTVSMPSSPLIRAVALPWAEPHTAQDAFLPGTGFGFGAADPPSATLNPLLLLPESQSALSSPSSITVGPDFGETEGFHHSASSVFKYADHGPDMRAFTDSSGSPHHEVSPVRSAAKRKAGQSVGPIESARDDDSVWTYKQCNPSPPGAPGFNGVGNEKDDDDANGYTDVKGQIDQADARADAEADMDQDIGRGPLRKKRHQVRVACTHCQKACKKCSATRPCERCVRYGLDDCVDSSRKPRRSGVKRGPYKRRATMASNGLAKRDPSALQVRIPQLADVDFDVELEKDKIHGWDHSSGLGSEHLNDRDGAALSSINDPDFISDPQPFDVPVDHFPLRQPQSQPPSSGLHSALSAALTTLSSRPTWVNGQRVLRGPSGDIRLGIAGTLMPHTPIVPFPLSLHGGHRVEDPFSRAVSPIRSTADFLRNPPPWAVEAGGLQKPLMGSEPGPLSSIEEVDSRLGSSAGIGASSRSPTSDPAARLYASSPLLRPSTGGTFIAKHAEAVSTPLNEGMAAFLAPELLLPGTESSSATAPPQAAGTDSGISAVDVVLPSQRSPPGGKHSLSNTFTLDEDMTIPKPHLHWGYTNPIPTAATNANIALKRIRKPSLRTLIVPGISREGSPVAGSPQTNLTPHTSVI